MIIKSTRIRATARSMTQIVRHLLDKPDENEVIHLIRGSRADVRMAFDDARDFGRKNAAAHFILASQEKLAPRQVRDAIAMIGKEFGFSRDDVKLCVRHQKSRHDGESWNQHFHLLVQMVNPANGRVMDMSHSYARQEKIERIFEVKNGMRLLKGRHNRAVLQAITDPTIRDRLAGLAQGGLDGHAYTATAKETGKRLGVDRAAIRQEVRTLWSQSDGWKAFRTAIEERGWRIGPGTRKPDVIVLTDGEGRMLGSLCRLLGMKKAELAWRMLPDGITPEASGPSSGKQLPAKVTRSSSGSNQAETLGRQRKTTPVTPSSKGHWLDPVREQIISTMTLNLQGKSEEFRRAEIATAERAKAQADASTQQLAEQKKFYRDFCRMIDELLASRQAVLPPAPQIRAIDEIAAECESKITSAYTAYRKADEWGFLNPWRILRRRQLDAALKASGFDAHDMNAATVIREGLPAAMTQVAQAIQRQERRKHREWERHPNVQAYEAFRTDLRQLQNRLHDLADSRLMEMALKDPSAAIREMKRQGVTGAQKSDYGERISTSPAPQPSPKRSRQPKNGISDIEI
ncbi:hypothetical protein Gxy13693_032_005 [Komagataeibacter xylinus NBRC 13693]|uniref:MobA/VirD2-like nuclease domain-containing protein n=1 Tax=Komagataeibacter xylinus NBRC 13693 TaxID=1234668 RepID=A0A0D6Q9W9_KOMXY|nr:hypothetical protein [Komagataeibacter xylinus]GAN99745.1 hypothetical protein Gxy13693_032_005 [Komagataeibacter xylinus NBRC 13693]